MGLDLRGVRILPGMLDRAEQVRLVERLRDVCAAAPLFRPETARGRAMSVRTTSAGAVGWVSDRRGYRYEPRHPSGVPWPPMPRELLALWAAVCPDAALPDTCLVNFYDEGARMGLHQDRDEIRFDQPVVSISLGDDALFRVGNVERGGRTESIWLRSGDVAILEGPSRLAHHGVDRTRFGSSDLLAASGRVNVTMRVAR